MFGVTYFKDEMLIKGPSGKCKLSLDIQMSVGGGSLGLDM